MKKSLVLITIFLIALSACWSAPRSSLLEPEANPAGYTGLKDETFEFNLSPSNNSKKPRTAVAGQSKPQTSSLRTQADFIDIPVLKARVIAAKKNKSYGPGRLSTNTELTAMFTWSGDTPLTGSVTLSGFHPPAFTGDPDLSSEPQTGSISTSKTNQNAAGFTGNAFRHKIPGLFECVFASWHLSSGPFQYVQDQPLKLCKQRTRTDLKVTMTGPRAPKVGFASEFEFRTDHKLLSKYLQIDPLLKPQLRMFIPDGFTYQSVRWATLAGGSPFHILCLPETPAARVVLCNGNAVPRAVITLVVRPSSTIAETFRAELTSEMLETNPADNITGLTVVPVIESTAADLRVIGHSVSSSIVFVEDQFEQVVTIKNAGPGLAANAQVTFTRQYLDRRFIRPLFETASSSGPISSGQSSPLQNCFLSSPALLRCDLPALNALEEVTVRVDWLAVTENPARDDRLIAYIEYAQDTEFSNNASELRAVSVSRDPLKEHALELALNAPSTAIEGQTHTSSVTVTNHGPSAATSRTLVFSPAFLIPVTPPTGCSEDTASGNVFCDLTGMGANSSRTFVFSGTASFQQTYGLNVSAALTGSGNDLHTYPQEAYQYVYVERDPNTLHSLELAVGGVQSEYFVNDPVTAIASVTNHGPSSSPPRELSIFKEGLGLNIPAGCSDEGWRIMCPIPSLGVGATWTQTITGTASTRTPNANLEINVMGNELESYNHITSFYKSFPVRGFVGLLGASFTPAPASSVKVNMAQTFTVVVTNTGQFSSVPDMLRVQFDRPDGAPLGGIGTGGLSACDHILVTASQQVEFCAVPVIPVGGSWSFSYTVSDSSVGRFRTQAATIGSNDRTGNSAYHEINTTRNP
jgi:hypothetical protein